MEIARELQVEQNTLGAALTRLRRRGLVDEIDGHWFALKDREAAKRQAAIFGNRAANAKWGREDPSDWPSTDRE